MNNHRLLLIKKDYIKQFGPVLNAPYSIAYSQNLIYAATYPDGIIEPAVIAILDDTGNYFGQLYLDHHVAKNKQHMMYSKNPEKPKKELEKIKSVKLSIKSLSSDRDNIVINYSNNESISFDASHPENAMLTNIGFRYVMRTSRNVRTKKSIFSYEIDNLSTIDHQNTSLQPNEEPAFKTILDILLRTVMKKTYTYMG
jgi:hypothetical protein